MGKVWKQPLLTVMSRTTPEEAILLGCKLREASTGAQNADNQCLVVLDPRRNRCIGPCQELRFP